MTDVRPFATADDVADAAVFLFVTLAEKSIAERGEFFCSLSGGRTPLNAYRILSAPLISSKVNWERTHVFWGDERCVPEGDPDRNDDAAVAALLTKVPIPPKHIHRVSATAPDAAARYEQEIRRTFAERAKTSPAIPLPLKESSSSPGLPDVPRFDLVFLGLGEDGHTASLFPGAPALDETTKLVVRVDGAPKPPPTRVSFTLPLLAAARHVVFLVTGKDKNAALRGVLNGDTTLPAARVLPKDGALVFLADQDALSG